MLPDDVSASWKTVFPVFPGDRKPLNEKNSEEVKINAFKLSGMHVLSLVAVV